MILDLSPISLQQNDFQDDDLVCHCFQYTRRDIEEDYKTYGESKILQKIKDEKRNNSCNCEVKNPKKR